MHIKNDKNIGYAIFITDLTDRNSDTRLDFASDTSCTSCEYIITNLINGHRYAIYIQAKNNFGYGEKSNTLVLIPEEGDSRISNISNDDKKIDDNISNQLTPEKESENYVYSANGILGTSSSYDLSNNEMNQLVSMVVDEKGKLADKYDINLFIN